jgi:hypothetical protein
MYEGLRSTVAAGVINADVVGALRDLARRESQTHPTPTGASAWTMEDVDEVVNDTVARVRPEKIVLAANEAVNDQEFTVWLRKALRTTLLLRSRETPSGRVIRAIDDALRPDTDRFVSEAGHWRLARDTRPPAWDGDRAALLAAAWEVETAATTQRSCALAPRADIRDVCAAVLEAAGPLNKATLADVLAERFNAAFIVRFDYVDDEEAALAIADAGYEGLDDDLAARWMLTQLTDEERRALAAMVAGGGVRELGVALSCGKTKASLIHGRLVVKLRGLAEMTGGDGREATRILLGLVGQRERARHSQMENGPNHDH